MIIQERAAGLSLCATRRAFRSGPEALIPPREIGPGPLARPPGAGYISRMESRFEEGRSASADDLRASLATAPVAYVEGALENPALSAGHLPLALKNPALPEPIIARIGRNSTWIKPYEVKAAIVLHHRAPRTLAMNLVTFLWWHDLARVAERPNLAPTLRRTAERILSIRAQELAIGEKISLARIASRGVINVLRRDENPMIVRALLQNPRLREEDALAIAGGAGAPAPVLQTLAEDSRWSTRPALQKAIARNPVTPPAVALRIIQGLSTRDLKELSQTPRVPALIKVAAQRLIEARKRPARKAKPGSAPSS